MTQRHAQCCLLLLEDGRAPEPSSGHSGIASSVSLASEEMNFTLSMSGRHCSGCVMRKLSWTEDMQALGCSCRGRQAYMGLLLSV